MGINLQTLGREQEDDADEIQRRIQVHLVTGKNFFFCVENEVEYANPTDIRLLKLHNKLSAHL